MSEALSSYRSLATMLVVKSACAILVSLLAFIGGCDAPADDPDAGIGCASAAALAVYDEAARRAQARVAELSPIPCASDAECVLTPTRTRHECANGSGFGYCSWYPAHQDRVAEVDAIYEEEFDVLCAIFPPGCSVSASCVQHPGLDSSRCVDSACVSSSP